MQSKMALLAASLVGNTGLPISAFSLETNDSAMALSRADPEICLKVVDRDFKRHAVYLPKKVVKRSDTPTPVGRIHHNAKTTSGRGQA